MSRKRPRQENRRDVARRGGRQLPEPDPPDTPTYTQAGTPWPQPRDGWPAGYGPGEAHDPSRGACCLCGKPIEGMGHNPAPLGEAGERCCNACNASKVIPARLAVDRSRRPAGERLAQRGVAYQGDLPGAETPGDRLARAPFIAVDSGPPRSGESAAEAHARWAAQIEADARFPDDQGERIDVATTLARGETPGEILHAGYGPAPDLHGPADIPELRAWLVRQWQTSGLYRTVAAPSWAARTGVDAEELSDAERIGFQRASLYSVAEPMVDLLTSVAPSCPEDTTPNDLTWPAEAGFVIFERPIKGTDAAEPDRVVTVDAVLWHGLNLPGGPAPGEPGRTRCLSVSSYRCLDFGEGLGQHDLALAVGTGAISLARTGRTVGYREGDGAQTFNLTGTVWVPLGRSDWPITDALGARPWWCAGDLAWASFAEDRRLIAALFTLLDQAGIASRLTETAPRHVQRRLARRPAGVTAPAPHDVTVVTLRRPKAEPHPDHVAPEPGTITHSHRWLVKEHMRWQPVGPGRAERRLTVVRAHVKGPDGAPIVIKTRVSRWVR